MELRSVQQLNFRNLRTSRLELGPGVTAVVGRNAAGKSNFLHACYLGLSAELPGGTIAQMLAHGHDEGFVGVEVATDDGARRIHIGLAPGTKKIRVDGQHARASDVHRAAAATLISPEDAQLVHGSPSGRRAYLDTLIARLSPRYGSLLREYARVLEQRNAGLKSPRAVIAVGPPDSGETDVWSERFADLGDEILALRRRAVGRISDLAAAAYADIAGDDKRLGVDLAESHPAETVREALRATRDEERARGVTVVGPHRDDLALHLDDHAVDAYGSRGEARTTALALRVAEYTLLGEKHGEAPVLLLDDFTAELDAGRRDFLLRLTADTPQAVVSGTEAPPHADRRFDVRDGALERSDP